MRGPSGLLKRVLLIEVASTEVLELRGVATQPEVSGQVGEVLVAVSWVWYLEAPYGRWIHKLRSEPASAFSSLLGPYRPSMRIRMWQVGHRPLGCLDCLLAIRAKWTLKMSILIQDVLHDIQRSISMQPRSACSSFWAC